MDDYTPEDLDAWKRFNSFASHLLSDNVMPWIVLPYWEIRTALETPLPQDPAAFECGLWVATEWLMRCGQLLRRDLGSAEALSEREEASIAPGPLCEGISPQGLERWEFWRSTLTMCHHACHHHHHHHPGRITSPFYPHCLFNPIQVQIT